MFTIATVLFAKNMRKHRKPSKKDLLKRIWEQLELIKYISLFRTAYKYELTVKKRDVVISYLDEN